MLQVVNGCVQYCPQLQCEGFNPSCSGKESKFAAIWFRPPLRPHALRLQYRTRIRSRDGQSRSPIKIAARNVLLKAPRIKAPSNKNRVFRQCAFFVANRGSSTLFCDAISVCCIGRQERTPSKPASQGNPNDQFQSQELGPIGNYWCRRMTEPGNRLQLRASSGAAADGWSRRKCDSDSMLQDERVNLGRNRRRAAI